jgi:DNA polymerase-3 subunit gamma/tau
MIAEKNGSEIDYDAIDSIARAVDGSMRDAISILDQCMDGTEGITRKKVIEVIGAPTEETMIKLAEAILNKDLAECMSIIDETIKSGKDISQFVSVMVRFFRDVLIFKTTQSEKVTYLTSGETNSLKEIAGKFSKQRLIKTITSMSELEANMRWASLPRVMFEIEMVKYCSQEEEIMDATVEKRIAKLEELLSNPVSFERTPVDNSKQIETIAKIKTVQASKSEANAVSTHVEMSNNLEAWSDVVSRLKSGGKVLLYANLIGTKAVKMDDKTIGIVFSKSAGEFGKTVLAKNENLAILKDAIKVVTGQEYNVKCITDKVAAKVPASENKIKERSFDKAEELAKEFDIPINVIE